MTCILFDLDGTLVDSEGLGNQAYLDLLPQLDDTVHGLVARYRGMKFATILTDLERRLGAPLPEGFAARYRAHVTSLFETSLTAMPGARAMLEALQHPRCVASSGPRAKIEQSLRVCGLAPFIGDRIFSAYEVGSWKPDPGLFLYAAHAMGCMPADCIVVEDSEVGLAAAAAAGMRAIHYCPHGASSEDGCVIRIDDHAQLGEAIRALASGRHR